MPVNDLLNVEIDIKLQKQSNSYMSYKLQTFKVSWLYLAYNFIYIVCVITKDIVSEELSE